MPQMGLLVELPTEDGLLSKLPKFVNLILRQFLKGPEERSAWPGENIIFPDGLRSLLPGKRSLPPCKRFLLPCSFMMLAVALVFHPARSPYRTTWASRREEK